MNHQPVVGKRTLYLPGVSEDPVDETWPQGLAQFSKSASRNADCRLVCLASLTLQP